MLGKLLKYEIKATARIFLPLYVVLLVFAAIHKLITVLSPSTVIQAPEVISMIAYIMIVVAVFVVTFVVMIQRFYKNLLSDEGYLMFTLPTKPWKHIVCKLLISMIWSVVSAIAAVISVLIIAGDKIFAAVSMDKLLSAFAEVFKHLDLSSTLFTIEFLVGCVIGLAGSVLIIYASVALGHLFNKHRVLASLGAYIMLTTVTQIIFAIASAIAFTFDLHPQGFLIHLFIWLGILFFGLISAAYFVITNYILSRHLNLE